MLVTTGGVTITLPDAAAVGSGFLVFVKDKLGSATADPITIDTVMSQTIDGSATVTLSADFEALTFVSDGADWSII